MTRKVRRTLLNITYIRTLDLSIVDLRLKHDWAHRLRINHTQTSIRLVRYGTCRREQSRLRKVCDARRDKSKNSALFWNVRKLFFCLEL